MRAGLARAFGILPLDPVLVILGSTTGSDGGFVEGSEASCGGVPRAGAGLARAFANLPLDPVRVMVGSET